ncbi:hypothetical protein [Pontibacter chitinilyticus]|uniref:hypothetical protein n=1 Tax=Pontibacter chitinilyticus TaxID=2674989 RepID=UPI00321A9807
MRPEDIDKLFKERLGNTSPTPSGDVWGRLQERIQAEMPEQQPAEKRPGMWVYYSVAATIALLLTVGLVFYNMRNPQDVLNGSKLAQQKEEVLPSTKPDFMPKPQNEQPAPAAIAQVNNNAPEKSLPAQATESTPAASTQSKAPALVAKAEVKSATTMKKQPALTVHTSLKEPQALAVNSSPTPSAAAAATITEEPKVEPMTVASITVASSSDVVASAEPTEIVIKRTVTLQPVATAEAPTGLEKKARLAKNIFKQVRNLSNGEPVELSELGIRADKIALETQIGKQKFSKVINL